ncbi:MAG: hypothetical protein AAB514_03000 [Patescibacteria group bacterium]
MIFFKKRKVIFIAVASTILSFIIFLIVRGGASSSFLVSISDKTYRPGTNNIGDIVGVFPGDWEFTESERQVFNIVPVNFSKEEMEQIMRSLAPAEKEVYQVDGEFIETEPLGKLNVEIIKVWQDTDGQWKEIKDSPKYKFSLKDLTADEIDDLNSLFVSVKTEAANKIGAVITTKLKNKEKIIKVTKEATLLDETL